MVFLVQKRVGSRQSADPLIPQTVVDPDPPYPALVSLVKHDPTRFDPCPDGGVGPRDRPVLCGGISVASLLRSPGFG